MSTPLTVTVTRHPDAKAIVIAPVGDIDLTAAPSFKNELKTAHAAGMGKLVVDLSGVPYMDSSGLATLVESMQTARRTGTKLVLTGLTPRVKAIFDIAKLGMVFTIVPTVDEALAK